MARHLFLLYTVVIIWTSCKAISSKWRRRREECRMNDTHVVEQREILSLNECLMICDSMQNCETVSWSSNGTTCLISNINTVDDVANSKWELASGWKTYSLVKYRVARFKHPSIGWMEFDEASEFCSDQHAGLATPDLLLEAEELGFRNCFCGWLSNERNGLVISRFQPCTQYPDVEGPELIYCDGITAAAYCKLK